MVQSKIDEWRALRFVPIWDIDTDKRPAIFVWRDR